VKYPHLGLLRSFFSIFLVSAANREINNVIPGPADPYSSFFLLQTQFFTEIHWGCAARDLLIRHHFVFCVCSYDPATGKVIELSLHEKKQLEANVLKVKPEVLVPVVNILKSDPSHRGLLVSLPGFIAEFVFCSFQSSRNRVEPRWSSFQPRKEWKSGARESFTQLLHPLVGVFDFGLASAWVFTLSKSSERWF
jgi:hypothetical protein